MGLGRRRVVGVLVAIFFVVVAVLEGVVERKWWLMRRVRASICFWIWETEFSSDLILLVIEELEVAASFAISIRVVRCLMILVLEVEVDDARLVRRLDNVRSRALGVWKGPEVGEGGGCVLCGEEAA